MKKCQVIFKKDSVLTQPRRLIPPVSTLWQRFLLSQDNASAGDTPALVSFVGPSTSMMIYDSQIERAHTKTIPFCDAFACFFEDSVARNHPSNSKGVAMKVILFGATGMVGQGVLRECLRDDDVEIVLAVGRSVTGQTHSKLHELTRSDMFDFSAGAALEGYDACFFCLGVSAAGMSEAEYTHLTFDLTLGWAKVLAAINPAMTFVYVSGAGTGGKAMWAQVKGRTEDALLAVSERVHVPPGRPAAIGREVSKRADAIAYFVGRLTAAASGHRGRTQKSWVAR